MPSGLASTASNAAAVPPTTRSRPVCLADTMRAYFLAGRCEVGVSALLRQPGGFESFLGVRDRVKDAISPPRSTWSSSTESRVRSQRFRARACRFCASARATPTRVSPCRPRSRSTRRASSTSSTCSRPTATRAGSRGGSTAIVTGEFSCDYHYLADATDPEQDCAIDVLPYYATR